jgi:ATP/maltotriose-dependent transcriptional regulator MalT
MPAPDFDVAQAHRYFAIECNNAAWDWLESNPRAMDHADTIIHTSEASFFHWSQVGTPVNVLRAGYLLANVYAIAGQAENAHRAVQNCLKLLATDGNGAEDWDRAFVLDAQARATQAGGDYGIAERQREDAAACGAAIADAECRQAFESWYTRWPS